MKWLASTLVGAALILAGAWTLGALAGVVALGFRMVFGWAP